MRMERVTAEILNAESRYRGEGRNGAAGGDSDATGVVRDVSRLVLE